MTSDPQAVSAPRALLYLRVSTVDQAKRGGEAEGFSLPAQRDACKRKAESLAAVVIGEYVEPGESAKTDQRPVLQAMLSRIKQERDIDIVIVHKVNRWARNRYDDALLGVALRRAGVQLVSAAENIDGTPSGMLLHGILATIAEFESANLATEVIKGATQKAKQGGTPAMAPVGYMNVREIGHDGRESRTIALDPERADLIRWAFETYATGDYSLARLLDELTEKGLTTKPMGLRRPTHPLHLSYLHTVMRNPYYKGIVRYRGVEYEGKHPRLVTPEIFERVQAILSTHRRGDKQVTHNHYLRGSLICGLCGARMCYLMAKGNGGRYPYYICLGRQRTGKCRQVHVPLATIEAKISAEYGRVGLTAAEAEDLREFIVGSLGKAKAAAQREAARQQRRLKRLKAERTKLLHAHYAGAVPLDQLKAEQARISREMNDAETTISRSQVEYEVLEAHLGRALQLMADCQRKYSEAPAWIKRLLNQGFFEKFNVGEPDLQAEIAEPFGTLLQAEAEWRTFQKAQGLQEGPIARTYQRKGVVGRPAFSYAGGLSTTTLVGATGFEPVTPAVSRQCSNRAELRAPAGE